MFGSSSPLPPRASEGGGMVCEPVGMADLLPDQKQSREAVDLLLTCRSSPSLTTFVFRSSEEVRSRVKVSLQIIIHVGSSHQELLSFVSGD